MSLFGFIPSANAQTTAGQPAADGLSAVLQGPLPMLAIMALIFYFLVFRPQQQRAKEHKRLLGDLKRGDSVVTSGGFIGTVYRVVSDDELIVEIADGVRVRTVRSTITTVNSKGEPRSDGKSAANDKQAESAPPAPAKLGRKPRAVTQVEDKAQD
jgi:preprotein translocase subunit YajC